MEKLPERSEVPSSNGNGTIDHVFDILNKYEHRFVLVGHAAHRWMGSNGCVDEGFDLVFRKTQINSITASLVETGHWAVFNCHEELRIFESDPAWPLSENGGYRELLLYLCDADVVLRNIDLGGLGFDFLRVWSDETYHIDVDDSPFIQVPELNPWNSFLVEKEFHPSLQVDQKWRYGPRTIDQACDTCPFYSTVLPKAKGSNNPTPIFILSIPAYLDALVYHTTHYQTSKPELASIAHWQIRNLTRYLYLELPQQKNTILFLVEAETEEYMDPYLQKYKRKPRYAMNRSMEYVRVYEWDPESYSKA